MLFLTSSTTLATTIGRKISVCTTDWRKPFFCRVRMYTQVTGSMRRNAPAMQSAVVIARATGAGIAGSAPLRRRGRW
jgi:hypothetical protein